MVAILSGKQRFTLLVLCLSQMGGYATLVVIYLL